MLKKILQSRWFSVLVLALIGFLAISFIKLEPALVTARKETDNLDKKVAELNKSITEFEEVGDYLKSNSYLEKQARLKLNYKKPDEKVVYVYTKTAEMQGSRETPEVLESKLLKNLKKWYLYLLGE